MANLRRRRHSRKRAAEQRRFVAGLLLLLAALAAVITWSDHVWRYLNTAPSPVPASAALRPILPVDPASHAEHVVYPYSVIEGGARTVAELKNAIDTDPVVAAHYADFSLENARVVELREPRFAHVSYRLDNRVFWTRKPVVLNRGERVLTDGVHVARTRCGNQVSDAPGEVSPLEPPAAALDRPANPALNTLIARLSPRDFPTALPAGVLPATMPLAGTASLLPLDPRGSPAPPLMLGGAPVASLPGSPGLEPEPGHTPDPVPTPGSPSEPVPSPPRHPGPTPGPPPGPTPGPTPLNPPLLPPEVLLPPGMDVPPDTHIPPGGIDPQTPPEEPPPAPVPEPGSALLMVVGGLGYAIRRYRQRRRD